MKKEEKLQNLLDYLFANYREENGFWVSSDNQAFDDKHKGDGVNHADTLTDKELVWCPRPGSVESRQELTEEQLAANAEREGLITRFTDLFSKAPGKTMSTEDLKAKIAEREERNALIAKFTEVFGVAPAANIGTEALKVKIAEKELEGNS